MRSYSVLRSKTFALAAFLSIWALAVYCLKLDLEILVYPVVLLGLIYEIMTSEQKVKVAILLVILGALGWVMQSLEVYMGTLIIFNWTVCAPPWLFLLWGFFMSSTLRTMPFTFRNIYISFLFGCYATPGTYLFISTLGLAELKEPIWLSLIVNSLISGSLFAITYLLLKFYFLKKGPLYVSNFK